MKGYKIIDTYPDFFDLWQTAAREPVKIQIERWRTDYITDWPEIKNWQFAGYEDNDDWRQFAREEIFPWLNQNFNKLMGARSSLLGAIRSVYDRDAEFFQENLQTYFLISVGVSKELAYVSSYGNRPAIYFDLVAIAREGWQDRTILRSLVGLQLGYYYFDSFRQKVGVPDGEGQRWKYFKIGFAREFARALLGADNQVDRVAAYYNQDIDGAQACNIISVLREKYNFRQLALLQPAKIEEEVKECF